MGLFDRVIIEDGINLPGFPEDADPTEVEWQTKQIGQPFMGAYKLASDGRLLRREREYREMTQAELNEKAQEHGYDSWDSWEAADTPLDTPLETWKRTVDEEWWVDHNMHGTFEFHASGKRIDGSDDDKFWSYEARFTHGDLEEIILLDDGSGESP